MKKTLQLEVVGKNPAKVGSTYILSLTAIEQFNIGDTVSVTFDTGGISRESIIDGIKRVFGFDKDDLLNGGSDAKHTYARKVYAHLRKGMGVSEGDIALELQKANASVAYYLCDNSIKVKEYCEEVWNG